jgi:hypothetical protein
MYVDAIFIPLWCRCAAWIAVLKMSLFNIMIFMLVGEFYSSGLDT